MAKNNGVSSKTHTQQQLNDYANQHNPNNKAYQARIANEKATKKASHQAKAESKDCSVLYPLDWMCYSNPYDFD